MYITNALALWITRRISWETFVYALFERPIAVAGKGGSYQVDPQDVNNA